MRTEKRDELEKEIIRLSTKYEIEDEETGRLVNREYCKGKTDKRLKKDLREMKKLIKETKTNKQKRKVLKDLKKWKPIQDAETETEKPKMNKKQIVTIATIAITILLIMSIVFAIKMKTMPAKETRIKEEIKVEPVKTETKQTETTQTNISQTQEEILVGTATKMIPTMIIIAVIGGIIQIIYRSFRD